MTLRLSPQRAHVRTARLVAVAMARRSGVQEDLLDEVRLAVGEACARAVQLHERYGVHEPVVVELMDGPRFEVVVQDATPTRTTPDDAKPDDVATHDLPSPRTPTNATDGSTEDPVAADTLPTATTDGGPFDTAPPHNWEEPLDTGIGLALLDALVDDITIEQPASGTRVRMCWPTT
ncbi:MAG TPA: ATP-binding protein [Mycobacteriales bacterium]|nr:ATP-binding protein [Mycobacteriales bacterium]